MSMRRKSGEEKLYYSPPALRRQNQQQQQLKSNSTTLLPERRDFGPGSYLDRFLYYTTPAVPARHFQKEISRQVSGRGGIVIVSSIHTSSSVIFGNFSEWSVYGAGVPLVLNGSDSIVQYYVPSLSAIQLYLDSSNHVTEQRRSCDDGDANSSRGTSSDGDSECGTDRIANNNNNRKSWNRKITSFQEQNCLGEGNNSSTGSTVDLGDINNPPGTLIFEYFEKELPFHREPLADKVSTLASGFPEIKAYKSCDLTSASWISVAWYPIYRIPVGPTPRNIDACFLTFHSLSKPIRNSERTREVGNKLLLPTFGLVSYKFKVSERN